MTVGEKREALDAYCNSRRSCFNCKLDDTDCDWHHVNGYEVDEMYKLAYPEDDDDDFESCLECTHATKLESEEPCVSCRHGIPRCDPKHDEAPSYFTEKESVAPTEPPEPPEPPKEDVVNHPNHYTNGGMECIDEMILIFGKDATMNFCLCNAWKYRRRALYKNQEEDMQKSHWYINKYKELKGKEDSLYSRLGGVPYAD